MPKLPWQNSPTNEDEQWEVELDNPDTHHVLSHGQHRLGFQRMNTHREEFEFDFHMTERRRRLSHDEGKKKTFIIDVEKTKKELLEQEDTDKNYQITIQDTGPKIFKLGTYDSEGYHTFEIRGTYKLSNLLQELELASIYKRRTIVLDEDRLNENPLERLSRLIKFHFWDGLTRRMDAAGLEKICADPKNRTADKRYRVYIPFGDELAWKYYNEVALSRPHLKIVVERLPEDITPEYVKSINNAPGILSLGLRHGTDDNNEPFYRGVPFVVPGGRFNEMYGWDSYFEALGLIQDGRVELARGMVENFWYELEHYNKILNANRSYYLTRSQPPFLTDMMKRTFDALIQKPSFPPTIAKIWILKGIKAAIKELLGVWLAAPRIDPKTGLSTYHGEGLGMPPETEASHFDHILDPYARKYGLDITTFTEKYQNGEILEPFLDEYFVHDRSVRESGHDTTYRFEKRCANLATVDLNSLLVKYERDLSDLISKHCNGRISVRIKRDKENKNFHDFLNWKQLVDKHGISNALGESGKWNTFWCRKLQIMDEFHVLASTLSIDKSTDIRYDEGPEYFTVSFPHSFFKELSNFHKDAINKYMWCPETKLYYDWDITISMKSVYKSVTALWTLWAELVPPERAADLVDACMKHFKVAGGLVSGTEESRGHISLERPNRQWDYPFGWAPHQILAWEGLRLYGFDSLVQETVYRWLYSIIKAFVCYNGVVPEKFDVVNVSHLVTVEYGNVGVDFKGVAREGFGWMNASYQIGLPMLNRRLYRLLANITHPDDVFK